MDRQSLDHFRQRWAEENFNGSIVNPPSSSSGVSSGDQHLTEVAAPAPLRSGKSSKGITYPSSPSGASSGDQNLTEVVAPAPLRTKKSSNGVSNAGRSSVRSWRRSLGLGWRSQERLTETAVSKRYTFQPRNPDEETALPTIPDSERGTPSPMSPEPTPPAWVTELYTISWLIFFSLLGTLSRLGVEAITQYPNAPVTSRVLWANLGGSWVMGYLSEDKRLFQKPKPRRQKELKEEENVAEYNKWKKTIPLYVGLATGYCGSFTSFSTFIRDAFLELTNALDTPSPTRPYRSSPSIAPRSGGFSFLALLAILVIQPAVSIAALQVGAQCALLLAPITPNINRKFVMRILNPLIIPIGFGCWLGASLVLSIIPPYNAVEWRTRAMFPLVFSPIGCLLRFYLSKYLNPLNSKFPLGTFASNIFGTMVLGMCWDLQHAGGAGLGVQSATACALLAGVQEGFCGCLSTVSTWVVELTTLGRKQAWIYGITSTAVGLASLVAIMGSMGWTVGFGHPACG